MNPLQQLANLKETKFLTITKLIMLPDECNKWWEQMSKHSYWLFQSVSASISFYSRIATMRNQQIWREKFCI